MLEITPLVLIALSIGLVEVAKKLKLQNRFLPLLAIIIGVGLSILAFGLSNISQSIITGLMIGLSSVGLYSGTKNTIKTSP